MRALVALRPDAGSFFSGCGKKADPRAPELATPRVIENLTATSVPEWRGSDLETADRVCRRQLKDLAGFYFSEGHFPDVRGLPGPIDR